MLNYSYAYPVITYLRQQKLILFELALLIVSIVIMAAKWGDYSYYQLGMAILL